MGVIEARRRILLSAPHVEATTPAGVANFTTDLISPLKSLKAGFLPVQSGSGDPSPSNVRPISGWSGLTVYKASENLFDSSVPTVSGRLASDGTIEANNNYVTTDFIPIDSGNYTFCVRSSYDGSGTIATRIFAYDSNKEAIGHSLWQLRTSDDKYYTGTFTIGTAKYYKLSYRITDFDIAIYSIDSITTIPVTFPAAGKNLFDKNVAVRKDGYTINYGSGEEASTTSGFFENYIPIKPSTTYTVSGSGIRVPIFYRKDKRFIKRISGQNTPFVFTSPDDAYYVRFQYLMESLDIDTVQLELGSTATSYEPYRNAYYGGYVDLVRGEVVAETAKMSVAAFTGIVANHGNPNGNVFYLQTLISSIRDKTLISNRFVRSTSGYSSMPLYSFSGTWGANDYVYFVIPSTIQTLEDANAWLNDNPTEFVYKLATPIHYSLTPQIIKSLRGTNNIWSDANGDVSIEYWKH